MRNPAVPPRFRAHLFDAPGALPDTPRERLISAPRITAGVAGAPTHECLCSIHFSLQLRKDFPFLLPPWLTRSQVRCQLARNVLVSIIAFACLDYAISPPKNQTQYGAPAT